MQKVLLAQFIILIVVLMTIVVPCYAIGIAFTEESLGMPTGNFAAVAAGDIDKDGYAEILSGRRDGQEGLFLFVYDGKAWKHRQITFSGEYGGVALADVTGDKILDILAVKTAGRPKGLEILRANLVEDAMEFEPIESPFTEAGCDDLAVGDVESDGDMDIAISTKGVLVLLNDGEANSFTSIKLATGNYEDTGVAFGDVNHDGRLDVVASNHPGENASLFLCNSSGEVAYDTGHAENLDAGSGIGYKIAIADFNSDKFNDLAIGSADGLFVYLGNGCKGADTDWWRRSPVAESGYNAMQVPVGDINRDDKPDLAFASGSGIFVLKNQYPEVFSRRLDVGLPEKGEYSGCLIFDLEDDGIPDIAISSLQGLGIHLYRGKGH